MATLDQSNREDFRPTASWANLRLCAELLRRVRDFFTERDFLEVQTPLLSADTVVDRHLDPLAVTLPGDPRRPEVGRPMWLQTSPEFAMKRLVAAGAKAIYQVARAFRAAEHGPRHNPEFTMVEWYRVGDSMDEGMGLLDDLCQSLLELGPAQRCSYGEAFARHVGVDPHEADAAALARAAAASGAAPPDSLQVDDRDGWLDLLLVLLVEPHLGQERPVILYDYPASQAALSRLGEADPPVAKRFELYVRGVELASGYDELVDGAVLRRRNTQVNAQRAADGKYVLPEESRLLAAMEYGLPQCTGVALGFDRVVMIAAGAERLADVMAFPADRA